MAARPFRNGLLTACCGNDLSLWGRTASDARFAIVPGSRRRRPSRRVIGLANIDIPRGRQAVQAWRRLDRRTRREVIRRARRGLGHPDPRVAAIAVGRAQATLTAPLWRWVAAAGLGLVAASRAFGRSADWSPTQTWGWGLGSGLRSAARRHRCWSYACRRARLSGRTCRWSAEPALDEASLLALVRDRIFVVTDSWRGGGRVG
jgi:hypothetical protein